MPTTQEILDDLTLHEKEFERIYKCLNKVKQNSKETTSSHLNNFIKEFYSIEDIYDNFYHQFLNQGHKTVVLAIYTKSKDRLRNISGQYKVTFKDRRRTNIESNSDQQNSNNSNSNSETNGSKSKKSNSESNNSEGNNSESNNFNKTDFDNSTEMAGVIDFINFATRTIPEFNGTPAELQRFVDAVNLVKANVGENELSAVEVVKTKLKDPARSFITNQITLQAIIDKLKDDIKPESPALILSKLKNLRQANKTSNEYVKEMENLSTSLKRAYISKGLSVDLAENFTTDNVLQSIKENTVNEKIKIVLDAGKFSSISEVFEKFLSVKSENGQSNSQINYFQRNSFENNRGNYYRNNGSYRGNRGFSRGNYSGNSSKSFRSNYKPNSNNNHGNRNFYRGNNQNNQRQVRYTDGQLGNSNNPQSEPEVQLGEM